MRIIRIHYNILGPVCQVCIQHKSTDTPLFLLEIKEDEGWASTVMKNLFVLFSVTVSKSKWADPPMAEWSMGPGSLRRHWRKFARDDKII